MPCAARNSHGVGALRDPGTRVMAPAGTQGPALDVTPVTPNSGLKPHQLERKLRGLTRIFLGLSRRTTEKLEIGV